MIITTADITVAAASYDAASYYSYDVLITLLTMCFLLCADYASYASYYVQNRSFSYGKFQIITIQAALSY